MKTATLKKTGWFIRKSKWADGYYPVYIFEDGDERNFAQHASSVEECRRVIREHFDNGRKAPERHTRPTAEQMEDALWRACLSDPF
jgi:hypothetical protein